MNMRHRTGMLLRRLVLALCLILGLGAIAPVAPAAASHNPTSGCWYIEGTNPDNPDYGPHWQYFPSDGGWWYYYWWEHWEECEDGWGERIAWHQHWHHYGW